MNYFKKCYTLFIDTKGSEINMSSLDYVMLFQIITFQRYKMTLVFFRGFNFKSLKNKSFNSIKKVLTCTRDI